MRVIFKDTDEVGLKLVLTHIVEVIPDNKGGLTCFAENNSCWTRPMKDLIGIYIR